MSSDYYWVKAPFSLDGLIGDWIGEFLLFQKNDHVTKTRSWLVEAPVVLLLIEELDEAYHYLVQVKSAPVGDVPTWLR